MPYKSKQAQKEAVRKAVQKHRAKRKGITGITEANVLQGITKHVIPGLIMDGNRIIGITAKRVEQSVPWYNPAIHKPGDTVQVRDFKGRPKTITVPDLDADGNLIP